MFDRFQKKFAGPIHMLQDFTAYVGGFSFDKFQKQFAVPIHMLQDFGVFLNNVSKKVIDFSRNVKDFFTGFDTSGVETGLDNIKIRFEPITSIGKTMVTVWNKLITIFDNVWNAFKPIGQRLVKHLVSLEKRSVKYLAKWIIALF